MNLFTAWLTLFLMVSFVLILFLLNFFFPRLYFSKCLILLYIFLSLVSWYFLWSSFLKAYNLFLCFCFFWTLSSILFSNSCQSSPYFSLFESTINFLKPLSMAISCLFLFSLVSSSIGICRLRLFCPFGQIIKQLFLLLKNGCLFAAPLWKPPLLLSPSLASL